MVRRSTTLRRLSPRRGLTLAEMFISIGLVGIGLTAALNAVGAAKVGQFRASLWQHGNLLADDLMSEILEQDYADPVDGPDSFGLRADESATADRTLFDDVDDYDGWSATPPQRADGTAMSQLPDWERLAEVFWVDVSDPSQIVAGNQGAKRIRVTVKHNGAVVAEIVALRTSGLPPLQACCFGDGSCESLRPERCTSAGGTAQAPSVKCATFDCSCARLLFVVTDATNPTAQELARKARMETWNYIVQLISASAPQSEFDTAVADADVAYISTEIVADQLSTKLKAAAIGVVNENAYLIDDFQLSSGTLFTVLRNNIKVLDNTHFITSPFSNGQLEITNVAQRLVIFGSQIAPGVRALAEIGNNNSTLATVKAGDELSDGLPAAGRRVQLPWGDTDFDFNELNDDGLTVMCRAIDWAAGLEVVCGDGTCDTGEECDCLVDCGVPAAFEQPNLTCDDGLDNDCDGATDCADINCPADPACFVTICNNGACEAGEDCNSCAADCSGISTGPPSGRYCCGNGVAETAEGNGSICDGNY